MTDYTDADVGLAAEAMYPGLAPPFLRHFVAAHRVLSALARAGRLLPPGGETRTEWARLDVDSYGRQREITTWPDGTILVTPWQPVPAESETDR